MESRNIKIDFERAQEWYNSNIDALKQLALEVYTEDELKTYSFESITTMDDVLNALKISADAYNYRVHALEEHSIASAAGYKINLIRKALNLGQKLNFTEGQIWYPYCPFMSNESTYFNDEIENGKMKVVAKFKIGCEIYHLLGDYTAQYSINGISDFDEFHEVGEINGGFTYFVCATKEIAQHMAKYFAKEIFEAKYADFIDFEWID